LTVVDDTLIAEQREYDINFKNRVEYVMAENPRMRRSTAERKTRELLGERPSENTLLMVGGNYNMMKHRMTLNQRVSEASATFKDEIEHRRKTLARWERNREWHEQKGIKLAFGNVVGNSIEGTFIHEYGHAIDATYGISDHPKFLKYYRSFTSDEIKYGVSAYATTDKMEFIAECFAESYFDDQRDISRGFMQVLEEIINDTH
jgi:hypothetical protein